jgi:hypothetical protein
MDIFALMIFSGSWKAKSEIKIDIVKPMPPKNPIPNICFQETSTGNLENLVLTANQIKRQIPIGFPTINPARIPVLMDPENKL